MKRLIISIIGALLLTGCSLDPVFYSSVTPDVYYDSPATIYSALSRPFTHWRWFQTMDRWFLQEYSADVMCAPQRYSHWEDGGQWAELHHHTWTPDHICIAETWRGVGMGVSMAYSIAEDLQEVDYVKCGLDDATKESHLQQLRTLVAYFYLRGLDFFGGMPIYRGYSLEEVPRSTAKETFEFIEETLKNAIPNLKPYVKGTAHDGFISQGAAAAMLAQLYFNAESYIGENRYDECALLCQDIIDQKYGQYTLANTWNEPFGFDNDKSAEIIWLAPSENSKYQCTWMYEQSMPYNIAQYYGTPSFAAYNGICMQPSLNPEGYQYDKGWRLGMPFSKFNADDVRKQPYAYSGSRKYNGMFLMGLLINPLTGGACTGSYEYVGEVLELKDIIAPFKQLGQRYDDVSQLPSDMYSGEENSGIRVVKYPTPNNNDINLRWNPDWPVIRLAEIYYMLAECKYRAEDPSGAAELFNAVRKRNFGSSDPDPVTAANIDKYRILDEWLVEFVAEGRRRTDLIRWNAFTTEAWWDHNPSNKNYLKLFPIPTSAMSSSNIIKQNPGYEY